MYDHKHTRVKIKALYQAIQLLTVSRSSPNEALPPSKHRRPSSPDFSHILLTYDVTLQIKSREISVGDPTGTHHKLFSVVHCSSCNKSSTHLNIFPFRCVAIYSPSPFNGCERTYVLLCVIRRDNNMRFVYVTLAFRMRYKVE